jgi:competence protein ComEC
VASPKKAARDLCKEKRVRALVVLFATLHFCISISPATPGYWILWNVGQGQWLTWIDTNRCLHFDSGGEINPIFHVKKVCGKRINIFFLSHWDWDHIGFLSSARRELPRVCISARPLGPSTPRKERLVGELPPCQTPQPVRPLLFHGSLFSQKKTSSNDGSQIFQWRQMLIPGDSTKTMEKKWISAVAAHSVRWLVLGHHGSRTSTSEKLLKSLPKLKMSFASAREKKYGHPHSEVKARLKDFGISVVRTQDWGHIRIQ